MKGIQRMLDKEYNLAIIRGEILGHASLLKAIEIERALSDRYHVEDRSQQLKYKNRYEKSWKKLCLFNSDREYELKLMYETIIQTSNRESNVVYGNKRMTSILRNILSKAKNANQLSSCFLYQQLNLSGLKVRCTLQSNQMYLIPTHFFASAMQYCNWHGRGKGVQKNGKTSKEVILEYAKRDPKTYPHVQEIDLFIFRDDTVMIRTHNCHRVAAAIYRGDKTIRFKGSCNIIYMPDTDTPSPVYWSQKYYQK